MLTQPERGHDGPHRLPLRYGPQTSFRTSSWERRQVGWDAYVEARGNRYSVPADLAGRLVTVRLSLEGQLSVYDGEQLVAQHVLQPADRGWVTVPGHHAALWARTLDVERRPLAVYEEAGTWN